MCPADIPCSQHSAVSVHMKSLHNAGEVERERTFRISANLARKLKEDKSMPTKREMTEGM